MIKHQCTIMSSFVLAFLVFSSHQYSEAKSELERGDSLSVEGGESDFLTSPHKTFTCGFYGLGNNNNAYWFAIWYTNSRDKTVTWVANRDKPVNSQGSRLSLRKDGTMTVSDVDGTVVWVTDTISDDVDRAELLDTGNLVLRDPNGEILWESFSFPTDTLLPHQEIRKSYRFTSHLRNGSFEPGYYSFYFDSDNVLKLIYDGPQVSSIYWPNPRIDIYANGRTSQNSSRIASFDDMGMFSSTDFLRFYSTDMGAGIKRRMTMDIDGNLRMYSLNDSAGTWEITWQAFQQTCDIHGKCGRFGICDYSPDSQPRCSCPPGYVVANSSDWRGGCRAVFNETALMAEPIKYLEISQTDYYGFDLNNSQMSLEDCKALCREDDRCRAFTYRKIGEAKCYTKSVLYNGYRSPEFQGSTYLKLPRNLALPESNSAILNHSDVVCPVIVEQVLARSHYERKTRKVRWVYLYSFCSALGGIEALVVVLGWWALFSKHGIPASLENGYRMLSSQFRRFTYAELKKATKNFKVELGRGGSGAVYKGGLEDGRAVAVKRLGDEFQGEEQFWAEMTTIGKINHRNLVRMWGFCAERKHRLLVYEYVENSSLDKHIYTSNILGWNERFEVALGTAKGLAYLHHECLEWVIHCDVKPENILLTSDLEPKIADFGLAKLAQRGDPGSYFTRIRGTKGYMAPEWALNQPITAKVDVYGYGVVILEMVNGNRISRWVEEEGDDPQETNMKKFVVAVKGKIESGEEETWMDDIVDKRLEGKFNRSQAKTLIQVGLSCVEENKNLRPTMASVVQTLMECVNETAALQISDVSHVVNM
ncbi:putative receptor protein kinase ZmPK1 [Ipomoea triloba]|uniref:putative receptor protein kinase ZmPK1 n=1 Tax=Ipomoea triloba TaxID=35885 RepID=UPI00125D68AC|nr:putative receptor protein kinase ZmPK1 [Ipomoea triloba]